MIHHRFRLYFYFIVFNFLVSCSTGSNEQVASVGKQGNIDHIHISDSSNEVIGFAARELQHYVKQLTGIYLPVNTEEGEKAISLKITDDTAIKWDGYRIKTNSKGLHVTAREPRGLLYAAYDLLEQVGCSFFYPGKSEQIIPARQHIEWKISDSIINPLLEHRGLAPYGLDAKGLEDGRNFIDWMAKNRMNYILVSEDRPSDSDGPAHGSVWKEVRRELLPELQKRGFIIEMSEHCTPVFFPRSLFATHPEWFALNGGRRKLGPPPYSGQMCYSNKAAVDYYGDTLASYAAAHPEFHTIGTWPLDGGDYCECENCKNPQTVFNAVLNIAEKIKKVRPDIKVEHLAYKKQTWMPPAMDHIPENITVLWCRDPGESEDLVQQWKRKIDPSAGIYQFEYYLGDNYRSRANLWLRPAYAVQMVRHAQAIGYRGVISLALPIQNWWRSSFNNRFYARASWDQAFNRDVELEKYYRDYYPGQAAQAKAIFTMIWEKLQKEPYNSRPEMIASNWPHLEKQAPRVIGLIESTMSQSHNPIIRERFRRIKTYVDFLVLHTKAYHTRDKTDFEKLEKYSQDRADESMVLMYPGYIHWRNEDYLEN